MTNEERPSKTQLKRQAEALQVLGERLMTLPEPDLAQLPLPDELLAAVRVGRRLQNERGALRRQRLYIGKLMRELDTHELEAAIARLDTNDATSRAHFHALEQWRDRMVAEGMPALEAFFDQYPQADRQRLRQLVLAASAEAKAGKPPQRQRELFRELRHVVETAG